MNRKNKLKLNITFTVINQFVTFISGFVLPRLIIECYGSEVNGLVSSITQFLAVIMFCELGVGAVVQSSLYKPIADNNLPLISKIYVSSQHFFRKIAYIVLLYIVILCLLYPYITHSEIPYWTIIILILAISFKLLIQYYFSITYRLILNAAQLTFIPMAVGSLTTIINIICSVYLIYHHYSIHNVLIISAAIFVLQPVAYISVVHKLYPINKKVKLTEEPIKQKWNGFAQHLASISQENSPVIVLTIFSNISTVSIYAIYHMVTNGLKLVFTSFMASVQVLLGDMYARNETSKLKKTFSVFEWFAYTTSALIYTVAGITLIPFIKVYISEVSDINYIYPAFGYLMCLWMAIYTIRLPYSYMIQAAGHFKQTQNSALIEFGISLVLSCALVFQCGLIGVAISSCIALSYRTIYFILYLSKHILNKRPITSIHLILFAILLSFVMICSTHFIHFEISDLVDWLKFATIITTICVIETLIISYIFFRRYLGHLKEIIFIKKRE